MLPIQLSVVFENVNCQCWTSNTLAPNNYVYMFPQTWLYSLLTFLRGDVLTAQSFLTEASAVDTTYYNEQLSTPVSSTLSAFFNKTQTLVYYIVYAYHLKLRLSFFFFNFNQDAGRQVRSQTSCYSVDDIFVNAGWLERELSEMYGVFFFEKKDHRKLLLDYSKSEFPMLKDFSTEGLTECFYDFFEEQVVTHATEVVEL